MVLVMICYLCDGVLLSPLALVGGMQSVSVYWSEGILVRITRKNDKIKVL